MKLTLLLLIVPALCRADAFDQREAVYLALDTVDMIQTIHIADHPEKYRELNPLFGSHPSVAKVETLFVVGAVAHYAIGRALPERYQAWWQYAGITIEAVTVAHNWNAGLRMGF